ncbi:deoxyribonuclease IV [Patescibacteria group bacterium]
MLFGMHVSIAGSIALAPQNAHNSQCECFQMFSRSPRGGPAPKLTQSLIDEFKSTCKKHGFEKYYIHTPYYINLASANNRIRFGSIEVIREELERGSLLGVEYVMTHLGSAKDLGDTAALKQVGEGLKKILAGYKGNSILLLENSAGAGKVVGDTFKDLNFLLKQTKLTTSKPQAAVCFDTCHAFASGYDLRSKKEVQHTLGQFDQHIGLEYLKLIHANDSQAGLGEHKDRHEHLGMGNIGLNGFRALVNHPKLKKVDMVLETPKDGKEADDLGILKKLRNST